MCLCESEGDCVYVCVGAGVFKWNQMYVRLGWFYVCFQSNLFFLHSCSAVFFLSEGERCFVFVFVSFGFVLFSRTQRHPLVCMCVPVRLWTLVWPAVPKLSLFFYPIITTHPHEGRCHGNLSAMKEKGRRGEENRDRESMNWKEKKRQKKGSG